MLARVNIPEFIVFVDGEARIVGKAHLKAELVARMHVDGRRDVEYVAEHYGITRAQVHAALAYYYENQVALDAAYEQSWAESSGVTAEELAHKISGRF